jgi:ribokinase
VTARLRLAVIGHVELVTLGRVDAVPPPGGIAYVHDAFTFAAGGGGVAFAQLVKSPAEVHFFTAAGADAGGDEVRAELGALPGHAHVARHEGPHTRGLAVVDPSGERTILIVGAPQHPRAVDPLPWALLDGADGVYFTGDDPETLRLARRARTLVVTARRRAALVASGVRADVVLGSARDPREASALADYPVPPGALVLTEGAQGGRIETAAGTSRFPPAPPPPPGGGAYGAGDSFAGALTFYLAAGVPLVEACARAAHHGAAVLRGIDPRASQLPLQAT